MCHSVVQSVKNHFSDRMDVALMGCGPMSTSLGLLTLLLSVTVSSSRELSEQAMAEILSSPRFSREDARIPVTRVVQRRRRKFRIRKPKAVRNLPPAAYFNRGKSNDNDDDVIVVSREQLASIVGNESLSQLDSIDKEKEEREEELELQMMRKEQLKAMINDNLVDVKPVTSNRKGYQILSATPKGQGAGNAPTIIIIDGSDKEATIARLIQFLSGEGTQTLITQERDRKREQELARKREQELAQRRDIELQQKLEEELAQKREQELARKREQELAQRREIELQQKLEEELARKREQELARRREIELQRKLEEELARKREQELARRREIELQRKLEEELAQKREEELARKREIKLQQKLEEELARKRERELARKLEEELTRKREEQVAQREREEEEKKRALQEQLQREFRRHEEQRLRKELQRALEQKRREEEQREREQKQAKEERERKREEQEELEKRIREQLEERRKQEEQERRQLLELNRKRQEEFERKRQEELDRKRQKELDRKRQEELDRINEEQRVKQELREKLEHDLKLREEQRLLKRLRDELKAKRNEEDDGERGHQSEEDPSDRGRQRHRYQKVKSLSERPNADVLRKGDDDRLSGVEKERRQQLAEKRLENLKRARKQRRRLLNNASILSPSKEDGRSTLIDSSKIFSSVVSSASKGPVGLNTKPRVDLFEKREELRSRERTKITKATKDDDGPAILQTPDGRFFLSGLDAGALKPGQFFETADGRLFTIPDLIKDDDKDHISASASSPVPVYVDPSLGSSNRPSSQGPFRRRRLGPVSSLRRAETLSEDDESVMMAVRAFSLANDVAAGYVVIDDVAYDF